MSTPKPPVVQSQPPKPSPPRPQVTASKKTASLAGDSAASTANEDTTKALEKLETKQKAIDTNNVARVANSHLTNHAEGLTPLVSLKNGKAMEKFPDTPKDIAKLSLMEINNILSNLDVERTGSEAARRERLRLQIGLKPTPA